jgi:hypothetical protein
MRQLICAAVLAVGASSAQAATMQAVYTGTVTSSSNSTGEFGVAAVDGLDGLAYVLTFLYDTDVGTPTIFPTNTTIQGGTAPGNSAPSPMISASLTINGVTRTINGTYQGVVSQQQDAFDLAQHFAQDATDFDGIGIDLQYTLQTYMIASDLATSSDLTQPFTLTGLTPSVGSGLFQFSRRVDGVEVENASGSLYFDTLTVSAYVAPDPDPEVPVVPLPAGLPLLVGGLGALALLRRRAA